MACRLARTANANVGEWVDDPAAFIHPREPLDRASPRPTAATMEAKTILITGASSGIGRDAARRFQSEGWNVVATMRTPENGAELGQLERTLVTRLDVTDPASIASAVAEAIERFGRIDVRVNNAGYGAYGPLEAFSMDGIRRQFDTNVIGLLAVTKAVLPHMRVQGQGTVVNISSIGGKMTFPLGALYHGTKFAVEGISEALHYELEPLGVRVKLVEPGAIATDCAGSEEAPKKIDVFRRRISIIGQLSPEERARLLEIADRCPVHRTLEAGAKVLTEEGA